MDMQGAIKQLQETAIVMAGIQARQAEALKGHEHQSNLAEHERRMTHIETNLSEATDKLNALISIVDDLARHRKERE